MSIIVCEGNERFAFKRGESEIYFHQVSTEKESELFAAAIVEGKKGEAAAYHNRPLFMRLMALEAVEGWKGVTDPQRKVLEFTRGNLTRLVEKSEKIRNALYFAIADPFDYPEDVYCLNEAGEIPVPLTEAEKKDSGIPQQ